MGSQSEVAGGGLERAPVLIFTVGGWETHDGVS
jgi:hypothetical protein